MTANEKQAVIQAHDWAGAMGEKWNRYLQQFESMIAPIGQATLRLAALQPGERVLDIGCGGGHTTLELAASVGPQGAALGLDISPVLIETARQRAAIAGTRNAAFDCADAATAGLNPAGYDVLFSRFGVMFFDDPVAAFRNMHGMLRQGARVVFCCWGPPPENLWVGKLSEIISRYVSLPPPNLTAPGPFAFADKGRTQGLLEQAGFHHVEFTPWRGGQLLGGPGMDVDGAAEFALKAFFVGDALTDQPEHIKAAVMEEVKALFRQHQTAQGIELAAMAWLVTAQA